MAKFVSGGGGSDVRVWVVSHIGAFRRFSGVIEIHTKLANDIVGLHMPEKDLNCAQVARKR